MAKENNDLEVQTFVIIPADESSVASPRLKEEEDTSFKGIKKSTSFSEITERGIAKKNKPSIRSKLPKGKQISSVSKSNKIGDVLDIAVMGMGLALVFVVIDIARMFLFK